MLNVLRQADEPDSTVPAPGLAQIDALIESARTAGLATTLTVTGNRRPLPPEVDLAAYRIVQESLANAIRHAGPAIATVSLGYGRAELVIEVADTGRGPTSAAAGGGHGLPGMRERAASVGGSVEAGPGRGGFRVVARFPFAWPPPAVRSGTGAATTGTAPATGGTAAPATGGPRRPPGEPPPPPPGGPRR